MMEVGYPFDGWRFATREEVRTFFADFTGSPDGQTRDPSIERKFLRLLGGDVDIGIHNDEGWSRIDIYIRVAGLVPATEKENANVVCVPGSPRGLSAGAVPPQTCNRGFVFHYAYVGEDRQNGQVSVTVNPYQQGWTSADGNAFGGIFLVRQR